VERFATKRKGEKGSMTVDEIRAVDVNDPSAIALLLRELVAQVATINDIIGDDIEGMVVSVRARYEGGLLVLSQRPHEGDVGQAG
jgi:hypothetical protein